MLTEERHQMILDYLQKHHSATVAVLSQLLNASDSTVRRDLTLLSEQKKLKKVHGGATILAEDVHTKEDTVSQKALLHINEKESIAAYAASLIQDKDFVFIDSGTTTLKLIEHIKNTHATYVTNGIVHAKRLIEKKCRTYILGGQVKPVTEAIVGAQCVAAIEKYHFTKAFLGTNGIHTDAGFTTPDIEESLVKTAVAQQSYMTYILSDHSKFNIISAFTFAPLDRCCIITDGAVEAKYKEITVIKEVNP